MKGKINFSLNFGYDSNTNDFNINGSLTLESDVDSEELRCVEYDDNQYIEYEDSDEQDSFSNLSHQMIAPTRILKKEV